jgi:hypothetical protein
VKITWLLVVVLVISVSSIAVLVYQSSFLIPRRPSVEGKDLFGIDEIYPTKEGGREWYIDMENPFSDEFFSSTFDSNITKQRDGSWHIAGSAVRLNVGTPPNMVDDEIEHMSAKDQAVLLSLMHNIRNKVRKDKADTIEMFCICYF